jgi:hypothetical protein
MDEPAFRQPKYVRQLLDVYRQTPGTTGDVHRPDRLLAAQLHQRGVPLTVVENALALAAARRLLRPATAPPLAPVRSLAYFLPIIEEVLNLNVSQDYFQHVRRRVQQLLSNSSTTCSR